MPGSQNFWHQNKHLLILLSKNFLKYPCTVITVVFHVYNSDQLEVISLRQFLLHFDSGLGE